MLAGTARLAIVLAIAGSAATVCEAQTLNTQTVTVGSGGGSPTLSLSAAGLPWTATANDSFLHVVAGSASGLGDATVLFTVDPYIGLGTRIGTLTIAGLTVVVTQTGTNWTPVNASVSSLATVTANYLDSDAAGNVYYVFGNTIRKWTASTGATSTLVSTGLSSPTGVAVASNGDVYITDSGNNAIKVWNASTTSVSSLITGLSTPAAIALDSAGNVYFSEYGASRIRKWDAGTHTISNLGSASLCAGIAVDGAGNVYFTDPTNGRLQKWTAATQTVSTAVIAGTGTPSGVAVDGAGNLYISYPNANVIDIWNASTQRLTTLQSEAADGVALDGFGNVIYGTGTAIKRVNIAWESIGMTSMFVDPAAGTTSVQVGFLPTTLGTNWTASTNDSWLHVSASGSGAGIAAFSYDANGGASPRTGTIQFDSGLVVTVTQAPTGYAGVGRIALVSGLSVYGVATDPSGNAYFVNSDTKTVVKWSVATGQSTTIITGLTDPNGIDADGSGNVYVADFGAGTVYKWTAATQQLGSLLTGLSGLHAVKVGPLGDVYSIDSGGLRKRDAATGQVTVLRSGLGTPQDLAVDVAGNVYIADYNLGIQKWTAATSQLSTLITTGLSNPVSLALDGHGDLLIGDVTQQHLFRWSFATQALSTIGINIQPYGLAADFSGNVFDGRYGGSSYLAVQQNLFVSPTSFNVSEAAGSGVVSTYPTTGPLGGAFGASNFAPWIHVGTPANDGVPFTYDANTAFTTRGGSFFFLGSQIVVNQAAAVEVVTTVTKTAGDNGSAAPLQNFGAALKVTVKNQYGNPINGKSVTFTIVDGGNGATGTFGGASTQSAATNSSGVATAPTITAGSTTGQFTVVANADGVTATFTLTVALLTQTIQFDALANRQVGSTSFNLILYTYNPSGLPLTFTSLTPATCSVSDTIVSLIGVGMCTIQATQPGNATYAAATPVSQSFQVTSKPLGITTIVATAPQTAIPTVTVTVNDILTGLPDPAANGTVTLTTNSAFAASATTSVNAVAGVATFSNLSFAAVDYGVTITATYAPTSQTVTSNPFQVLLTQLGTSTVYVGSAAGTSSISLTTPNAWTATANDAFLHISSGSESGTGSAIVVFTYDEFTGTGTRSGTLTLGGLTLTVTQAGTNSKSVAPYTDIAGTDAGKVAVDAAGDIYYIDYDANAIKKYTVATQQVSTLISSASANCLAVASDGTIYFGSSATVKAWSPATGQVTTITTNATNLVYSIAVDQAGNVYYYDLATLKRWSAATQTVTTLSSNLSIASAGTAVDLSGNVFFTDTGDGDVRQWNATTGATSTIAAAGTRNMGIAVDGSGNVYFENWGGTGVRVYSPATQQQSTLVPLPNNALVGLARDSSGNLIMCYGTSPIRKAHVAIQLADSVTVGGLAGSSSAQVSYLPASSMAPWTASTADSWIHLTTTSGAGPGTIQFTYDQNVSTATRTGTITLNSGLALTVTQRGLPVTTSMVKVSGDSQTAAAGQAFAAPVQVKILDQFGDPFTGGVAVTFAAVAGGSGASGTLASTPVQPIVTGADGIATSPIVTANSTAGAFTVTATAGGGVFSQTFTLTISVGSQTITFGTLSDQAYGTSPFGVSATASSGLPVSFASTTTGVCTVVGTTVTLVATGTCTIEASQAGNGNFSAAEPVSRSFQVTAAAQTITFGALLDQAMGTAPFGLTATATSGLTVSFASTTAAVCTVSGTTVTLVATGTCTIQATQTGNGNYQAAAPVSQSFQVTLATQTISFNPQSDRQLGVGTFSIGPTASSGLPVTVTALTPSICSVSGTTVTLLAVGTCTLEATQAGNSTYAAATPVSRSFAVLATPQTISFNPQSDHPLTAGSFSIGPFASSGLPVTVTSLTPSICSVSGTTVTLLAIGTCTLEVTQAGNATYAAATPVSRSFEVTITAQTISFNAQSDRQLSVGTFSIGPFASSGLPVSVASLTPSICSISGTTVTLIALGTCTLEATQAGNAAYSAAAPVDRSFAVTSAPMSIGNISTLAPLTTAPALKVTVYDIFTGLPDATANGTVNLTANTAFAPTATTSVNAVAGVATFSNLSFAGLDYSVTVTATYVPTGQAISTNRFSVLPTQLGTSAVYVGKDAGSGSVFLTTAVAWTATSNASFLHVSGLTTHGTGSALVEYTFDAFAGTGTRTGTLTVAGLTLTVTQAGTNSVAVTPVTQLAGTDGSGVAVDAAGDVYYVDTTAGAIKKYSVSTQQITTLVAVEPNAFAVAPDGTVYFSQGSAAKTWSPATGQVTALFTNGSSITALGLDAAGNVYFSDTGHSISRWRAADHTFNGITSTLNSPFVGVDGAGKVFHSVAGTDILKVDSDGGGFGTVVGSYGVVTGLVLDGTGDLYYAETGAGIRRYQQSTTWVGTIVPLSNPSLKGLARDSSGNFYVTYSGGPIQKVHAAIQLADGVTVGGRAGSSSATVSYLPVSSMAPWTASTADSWIHLTTTSGAGVGSISFTYDQNPTTSSRTGTVTLDSGLALTVTQTGLPVATSMSKVGGDAQSAGVGAAFVAPLQVKIVDQFGDPYPGAYVTFAAVAGGGGSTATFGATPVQPITTGADGIANSPALTANTIAGAFTATATSGSLSQTFTLSISTGSQTITFGPLSNQVYGAAPFAVSATASSGLPVSFASTTTAVCTVSVATVSLVGTGTCTIQASQAGDANYIAATPVSQSFQVTAASQTITFGPLSNQPYGTAPFALTATASSGLPVSFASTTTAVCTVSAGTVTLVATGACTIQATQSGNGNYQAASPVSQTFQVTVASQTITFSPLTNQVLGTDPFSLTATASSGLPVTLTSQTTAVCTVSGAVVTLVAAGTCTIQATQTGNSNYDPATAVTRSFQVTTTSQTITFNPLTDVVFGAAPISVSATASSGLTVAFQSQTTAVCTVAGTTVTTVGAGTCTIRATQAGNATYAAATPVDQSFQVTPASQTITFALLPDRAYGSAPFTVSATSTSGLAVNFLSLTTAQCTVSGSTVTVVAVGPCEIHAYQPGNTNYTPASTVDRSFHITKAAQTITFDPLADRAYGSGPFAVSGTASSGLTVGFASLTAPVCTVSGTTVTIVAPGTCTIEATQAGDGNYSAATAVDRSFTVTAGSQTIAFGPLSNVALGSGPVALSATASSSLPVSFASTTTAVCTVSGASVTLVTTGTCTIQATQSGNATYAAATPVNQSFQVTAGSQTITFGPLSNAALGSGPVALSATASSGLPVSFASTTTSVCTVSGTAVTLVAVGTCTIQATQSGNATYAAATPVNQSFQVTAGSQTITFGPLSNAALGSGPVALSATASSGLPVSFASTTTSVCTVSGTAVTLVAVGTCTIQATQAGNGSYAAATPVNQSFQVTSGSQTITFGPLSNAALGSGPISLVAIASSTLPVSFASTTTSICTVSAATVTLLTAGTCTIQATQTGNSNYAAATPVNQSFQVTSGSQTITFGPLPNAALGSGPITLSATASSTLPVSFDSTTTGVCTVSGTTITLVATGTCAIQATQSGNTNYAAATPVSQSFQVTAGSQTITFGPLSNAALGSGPVALSATASSGLPVSFASTTTSICTVSTATVNLLTTGTCTIQATQSGNGSYAAATPVSKSFQVTAGSQTITFGPLSNVALGSGPVSLSATASSGLPVSFASTTTSICTVSTATVNLLTTGTCTIQATQSGNGSYAAATPVSQSFQVTAGSQTITFGPLSNAALGSGPVALSATASSGLPVSFASTTTSICTVSTATVTLLTSGTCTIQATQSGNTNYAAATPVSQSFQVTAGSQTITFAPLSNAALGSGPIALSATASSGLPVSFASTTTSICTVSAATVTLLTAGMCTIQATQSGNGSYAAATPVSQSFQVTAGSQTITFGPLSNVALGSGPVSLSATATSGLPVSFASTTTSICTVSTATVTLLTAGTCTIQATQSGNSNYAAATPVSQSFQVTAGSQTITFAPLSNAALGSGPVSLSATASSGLPVSFASTTTSICTVSTATVTLLTAGTCTIQATQSGNSNYAAATPVSQSFQVTAGSQTITFAPLSNAALTSGPITLSATASSGLPVSFASTTTSICTVSAATATLLTAGTCTIQATQSGNSNYAAATPVSQSFQVTAGSQTITFGPLSNAALGSGPIALSATATSGLPVSFASTTTSICTVSAATVTLLTAGTCTIQATQSGNSNYAAATPVSQSFQVTAGSQTITFGPLSNAALGSGPVALSATASSGLPVSFASTTTSICTVSAATVTLLTAGTCTIQATQSGNSNYAAATPVSQSFQVTAGSQTITFAPLSNAALTSGPITLSATASSGLPVSFASTTTSICTVSGATVTLLTAGTCTIQATQSGNTNYAAATPVSQSFQILQPPPAGLTAVGGTPQSAVVDTIFNVPLQALVTDAGGKPISGVTVVFTAPGFGPTASLSSPSAVTNGAGIASVTAMARGGSGSYTVGATVAGLPGSVTFALTNTTLTASFTVQTSPSGLPFTVDGLPYTSSQVFEFPAGSVHVVAVNPTIPIGPGVRQAFAGWSDGLESTHTVTASFSQSVFTAKFQLQYELTTNSAPSGFGTVAPTGGYFNAGSTVTLIASPATGALFYDWAGPFSTTTSNRLTVTMQGPITVGANFRNRNHDIAPSPVTLQYVPGMTPEAAAARVSVITGLPERYTVTLATPGLSPVTLDAAGGTAPNAITVLPNPNLPAGTHKAQALFQFADGTRQTLDISVQVQPQAAFQPLSSPLRFTAAAGSTTPLTGAVTLTTSTRNASFGLVVTYEDPQHANWLTVTPPSGTTPANLAVAANPAGLPPGTYRATILASGTGLVNSPFAIPATLVITPAMSVSAIANAASGTLGSVAPNTIVTAYGTFPGCSAAEVSVNGEAAPVFYSSAGQINFLVPGNVAGLTSASAQISCNGVKSGPVALSIAPAAPALFTASQNGTGQAAIVNADGSISTASTAGTYVQIYATGLGAYGPAGSDGLRRLSLPVTATLGGVALTVLYAGEAPGYTDGLQQINVLLPVGVGTGTQSLVLQVGDARTQSGVALVCLPPRPASDPVAESAPNGQNIHAARE